MAEMIKVNKKVIFDPMFTPVRQWLTKRIAQLEIDGTPEELALAKERYDSLVAGDIVIEDVKNFADGIQRVCIVARKTGFARVDIEFERATMQEILNDFGVTFVSIKDIEALKTFSKTNKKPSVLLWLEYKKTFGVLLTQDAAKTIEGPMEAFGDLFFNQYTTERESLDYIDYDTIESGTVTIKDPSMGAATYPLFIQELVLTEANLPIITSNLPEFIETSRGATFSIPNTYWFGGTLDITQTATVEITTAAGYTIPARSADKLSIDGPVIYGSSKNPVTDQIIVRVTHTYMGRPVRRTFRIEVRIQKDAEYDLTFEVRPDTISAAANDEVQVVVYALFKGQIVEIPSPVNQFVSPKHYGNLGYVETQSDFGMVYTGKITGVPPVGLETDMDLYSAEMSYMDGSTPYTASAFISLELVRANTKPVFTIKGLTTTLRGYLNDVKQMEVKAFYGDDPVPATELRIRTGPRGDKQLIRFDSIEAEAVNYTVIRDSQQPGKEAEDEFEQVFTYLAPDGVRHTPIRTIKILIQKASTFEIVPVPPNPLPVTRYQKGGARWKCMVNGVDETSKMLNLAMVSDDKYVTFGGNQWTIKHSDEEERFIPAKFTWLQAVDGINVPCEFDLTFQIKIWDPGTNPGGEDGDGGGTGEGGDGGTEGGGGGDGDGNDGGGDGNTDDGAVNTEVVVFPMYFGIGGLSDERGKVYFRVYSDGEDISKTAVQDVARKVIPAGIRDEGVQYDEATGKLVWTYFKLDPMDGAVAKLFFTDPKDGNQANLPPNRRGRMYVTSNVKQSRILKLVERVVPGPVNLEQTTTVTLKLSFAGDPIDLTDPRLTMTYIPPTDRTRQCTLLDKRPTELDYTYTTLEGPGSSLAAPMQYEFSILDDVTGETQKLKVQIPLTIKMPPLVITYVPSNTIDTRMWGSGTMPFKATFGTHDITNSLRLHNPSGNPINPYVTFGNPRTWRITDAKPEGVTTTATVHYLYDINSDFRDLTTSATVTFNIEGWDGITFEGDVTPAEIAGDSGTSGELLGKFTYQFNDATNGVRLDRSLSSIPENILVEDPVYDNVRKLAVIRYQLIRGGDKEMKLVFRHPTVTSDLAKVETNHTVKVKWPVDLNLESTASNIEGWSGDIVELPLFFNFSGNPLSNNSADLALTYTITPADYMTVVETKDKSLRISLDKGGAKNTTYDCNITINAVYTNPEDGQQYTTQVSVPTKIKVPDVVVASNPPMIVDVYTRGKFKVALKDSRGQPVPITSWTPNGTNNYISFVAPDSFYVTKGSTEQSILTEFPLTVAYDLAGGSYTEDVVVTFQINQFDNIDFTVESLQDKLEGKAGIQAVAQFKFTYKGDITHAVRLSSESVIPPNLLVGDLTNSQLPYTLKGQGRDTARFVFLRNGAPANPVENKDFVVVSLPVISTSSDEPFTLVSSDDELELDWEKTGVLNVVVKYGSYELPANAPGLSYHLKDAGDKGVTIAGATAAGIQLRADLATTPGTRKSYLDMIEIRYDVGAGIVKTLDIAFNTRIFTPTPVITLNETVYKEIWDKDIFKQSLNFNADPESAAVIGPTSRVKVVPQVVPNQYIEMYTSFSYEVVGAPATTQTVNIPLTLTYTLKGVPGELTFNFNASMTIVGHVQPKFYCQYSPSTSEGVLDETRQVRFRPLFKDEYAPTAQFKQDLTTLPPQVEIVSVEKDKNNAEWTIITLKGIADGVGEGNFVWWSPEAEAPTPGEDDIWNGKVTFRIMGEPGIEVGDRDDVLVGKNGDTGVYKLELLFGGIPLNINGEISKGLLTMTVKPYNAADKNAQVMTITETGEKGFDYALNGTIWPGHVVDTKEILVLTYRYGGQTYTREVEVPVKYTSSELVITGVNEYKGNKIYQPMKTIGGIRVTCDGIDLTPSWNENGTIAQVGVQSQYIKYVGKRFDVIKADAAVHTEVVKTSFTATYRGFPWEAEMDISFEILEWDGKTFKVYRDSTSRLISGYVGDKVNLYLKADWRAQVGINPNNTFNPDKTDLKGLIDFQYRGNSNGFAWYEGTILEVSNGDVPVTMYFDRQVDLVNYPLGDPQVEWYDYVKDNYTLSFVNTPLTITGSTTATGGNEDVIGSGKITVMLKNIPIQIEDPNLEIIALDPDVMIIDMLAVESHNYRIKLPLDTVLGSTHPARFKYVYTDPGTGRVHEGTRTVTVTYRQPSDYPVVTAIPGALPDTNLALWEKTKRWFKVTSKGQDISSQTRNFLYTEGNLNEILQPWAWDNEFYLQCIRGTDMPAYRREKWTIEAPFRGDWVTLSYPTSQPLSIEWATGLDPSNPVHITGTYKPNPVQLLIGAQGKIEFNMRHRGAATTNLNLNVALSDFKGALTVDSIDRVAETNTIVVNYTALKENADTMSFCWEIPDQAEYVDNYNRVKMNVTYIPGVKVIHPDEPQSWGIWLNYALPFEVKSGETNLLANAKHISVNDPYLVNSVPGSTSSDGPRYRVMNSDPTDTIRKVTFKFELAVAPFTGLQMTVEADILFRAWDGKQFEAFLQGNMHLADDGKPIFSIPRGRRVEFRATAKIWDYNNPNGAEVSTHCKADRGLIDTHNLVKWIASTTAGGQINTMIEGVTVGYVPGKFAVDYAPAGNWTPNGFPPGTEKKNRHTLDVYYEVFEPELTFENELPPAEERVNYQQRTAFTRKLKFGRADVSYRNCTITVKATDTNKATVWGTPTLWENDAFYLVSNYNNPYEDLHTEVEVTILAVIDGVAYTKVYMQKLILTGTNAETLPTFEVQNLVETSAKVFDKGTQPFSVVLTSPPGSLSWSTKSATIKENPYVRNVSLVNSQWLVYNGSTTAAVDTTITYDWVMTDGVREIALPPIECVFHIAQWDGQTLKATIRPQDHIVNEFVDGFAYATNQPGDRGFIVTYQGLPIGPGEYTMSRTTTSDYMSLGAVKNNLGNGQLVIYMTNTAKGADQVKAEPVTFLINKIGKGPGIAGSVEGVDYIYFTTDYLLHDAQRIYPIEVPEVVEGEFGDKMFTTITCRRNFIRMPLDNTFRFSVNPGQILMYDWTSDIKPDGVTWYFKNRIDVEQVVTDHMVTFGIDGQQARFWTPAWPLKSIQNATAEKPVVDQTMDVETYVSQKGKLPFRVQSKGVDVTEQCKNIVVDGGKYVKGIGAINTDDVWEVIASEPAGVTAPVKFTFDIVVDGVTFKREQSINFVIAAFNDAKLVVNAAETSVYVGIGKPDAWKFTGSWGTNPLNTTVELDQANSQLNGFVTVAGVIPNADGSLTVNVIGGTEKSAGEVVLRFKVKNGNAIPVEGYDWVDVSVWVDIMLNDLAKVEPFDEEGAGTQFVPARLNQAVSYDGITLKNTDPDLKITLSAGSKVALGTIFDDVLSYRFLAVVTTPTVYWTTVIFEYKGVAKFEQAVKLTQNTVEGEAVITDIENPTVEDGKTYKLPFKVLSGLDGRDITHTAVLTGLTVNNNAEYFSLNGDDTYTVVYKNTDVDVTGTATFNITVSDAGFDTPMAVEVPMVIKKFSGNTLKVKVIDPVDAINVLTPGSSVTYSVVMERFGLKVPVADWYWDETSSWGKINNINISSVTDAADGFTKVITFTSTSATATGQNSFYPKFKYRPLDADTPTENKTFGLAYVRVQIQTANMLSIQARAWYDSNTRGAIQDLMYTNLDMFYNGARVYGDDPRFTAITLRANTGTSAPAEVELATRVKVGPVLRILMKRAANFYIDYTFLGVKYSTYHSVEGWSFTKSVVNAEDFKAPAANVAGELLFTVPRPVYTDWSTAAGVPLTNAPTWILDGSKIISGTILVKDKQTGAVKQTLNPVGLVRDNVGRYHVPITRDHRPIIVEMGTAIQLDSMDMDPPMFGERTIRSRVPVVFPTTEFPGAPVLASIDDNIINPSTERSTTILFRLNQIRSGGTRYTFDSFTYGSVEGTGVYVANGVNDPATKTQYITLKGTGENGDILVHGTCTDDEGYVYDVTLRLKAEMPLQVEFVLADNEITAYEQETVTLNATATYQGADLALNKPEVVMSVEPVDGLEIVTVGATTIDVKVIKEVDIDTTIVVDVVLTAYGEVHKQSLGVHIKAAAAPLIITGSKTITGGTGDTGSSTLTVTMAGNNIPLNDPKLTFDVPSDFEITSKLASSFLYTITTPMGNEGPRTVKVTLKYEVAPGIFSTGEYNQEMVITKPADYPRVESVARFFLDSYLYGLTAPSAVIKSGTTDISAQCTLKSVPLNSWLATPEGTVEAGKWFWVVDGPVSGQAATKTLTYIIEAPYKGDMVELQVTQEFAWGDWVTPRDTWVITHSPDQPEIQVGTPGEIVFDIQWAGRKTTNVDVTVNTGLPGTSFGFPFERDGKLVIAYETTSMTALPVDRTFTFTKKDVDTTVTNRTKAHLVTFKELISLVLNFNPKVISGKTGDIIKLPYTLTSNGAPLAINAPGTTRTMVPEGILEIVSAGSTDITFKLLKKVNEDTLDDVVFTVGYKGSEGSDTLNVTTKKGFYVEAILDDNLRWTSSIPRNVLLERPLIAYIGDVSVPADSPDLEYNYVRTSNSTLAGTIFGVKPGMILIENDITGTASDVPTKLTVTHKPTGETWTQNFSHYIEGLSNTTLTFHALNTVEPNASGPMLFRLAEGSTSGREILDSSLVTITSNPKEGNAALTSGPLIRTAATAVYEYYSAVTTGWTGKGVTLSGFVKTPTAWWRVATNLFNVKAAPLSANTEKADYIPDVEGVTVKFRITQQQGSEVAVPADGTFGVPTTSGEIASVGAISASGDPAFPYQVTVTPTGNVGTGTMRGMVKLNGVEQEYTLVVTLAEARLTLVINGAGSSASSRLTVTPAYTAVELNMTLKYGDDIIPINDPRVVFTFSDSTGVGVLQRLYAKNANILYVKGNANRNTNTGTNTVGVKMLDLPGKTGTAVCHIIVSSDDITALASIATNVAPPPNTDDLYKGRLIVNGTAQPAAQEHYLEMVRDLRPQQPVLELKSNIMTQGPSNVNTLPMLTGWTGGTGTIRGIVYLSGRYRPVVNSDITINQQPLDITEVTGNVYDSAKVTWKMNQVRGPNGTPVVDISTLNGTSFKNITFDTAVIESVATMKVEEDGGFSMVVTRKAGNTTSGPTTINAVATVEGVDYPIAIQVMMVVPASLVAVEGFPTVIRGNKDNPVTLTQSVYLPN